MRCLEDLHAMLSEHGDWMVLGSADESKPAADGIVEAWARPLYRSGCWSKAVASGERTKAPKPQLGACRSRKRTGSDPAGDTL